MRKILIAFIYPPIPDRRWDWRAWYEGEEDERMDHGEGSTEEAAIRDLIENYPRCREEFAACIDHMGTCLFCEAENGVACRKALPRD